MADFKKILLVEDDDRTRNLYADIFKTGGFDVQTAIDGQDGLSKAKNDHYSLILLDIMMPNTDGLQFLAAFKALGLQSKIVVFTNLSHASVVDEAKRLGADEYIVKSDMNPDKLLEKIKGMI